jgi:hypothetical protein
MESKIRSEQDDDGQPRDQYYQPVATGGRSARETREFVPGRQQREVLGMPLCDPAQGGGG